MRLPTLRLPRKLPFKVVAFAAAGMALAGSGFAVFSFTANASRVAATEPVVRPARVVEVAYRRQVQSLSLAGTVVPRIESTLGFRDAGKIVRRAIDVGAAVKPGDVIAELDPTDYRLAVDNARAALVSAEADYARAKAVHERYLNLRGSTAFVPQTLDQRQSLASTALARVDQAKSQVATAENNLDYTVLRADAAGPPMARRRAPRAVDRGECRGRRGTLDRLRR